MKATVLSSLFVTLATAHTTFTTLFVNGKNQGDGTCVRMSHDLNNSTSPIPSVTGDDMACGIYGNDAVDYICPVPAQATLTFEFRDWTGGERPGSIAWSHHGPCAVYAKKVDDVFNEPASGPGWFKIWEDGYDTDTEEWCVDRLIQNRGLLSVDIPQGLPSGYYLFRTEILALHSAIHDDPQFFVGCAQVFIQSGPDTKLKVPDDYAVSIPGYVDMKTPGLTFNIYTTPLPKYDMPGPKVYVPSDHDSKIVEGQQKDGVIPSDCILKNGNWCAKPVPSYSDEKGCWSAVNNCWAQSKTCWSSVPATGGFNCYAWQDYCEELEDKCHFKKYNGPPQFYIDQVNAPRPGPIPKAYGEPAGLDKKEKTDSVIQSSSRSPTTSTVPPAAGSASVAAAELSSTTSTAQRHHTC